MVTTLKDPVGPEDHIRGAGSAPLEIVEYGDYECPYCGLAFIELRKVREALGENIKFVFRNFPLTEVHPDAFNAALTAEAAGLQGKYWEMHDILFHRQRHLSENGLTAYASQIGLNIAEYERAIHTGPIADRIKADLEGGIQSGVKGTPTFFINGKKYEEDWQHQTVITHLKTLLKQLS